MPNDKCQSLAPCLQKRTRSREFRLSKASARQSAKSDCHGTWSSAHAPSLCQVFQAGLELIALLVLVLSSSSVVLLLPQLLHKSDSLWLCSHPGRSASGQLCFRSPHQPTTSCQLIQPSMIVLMSSCELVPCIDCECVVDACDHPFYNVEKASSDSIIRLGLSATTSRKRSFHTVV